MKIVLASVGKSHDTYVKSGIDDFSQRLQRYFPAEWLIIPPPKNAASLPEALLKKEEAKAILQIFQQGDVLVLLDERGKQLSSPEVATFIQQKANSGIKRIIFLIGGAFGVEDSVKEKADFVWCLSKLVFPHMLVRLILSEQLYRACTILRNEKYHHE